MTEPQPPAGWYPDPQDAQQQRWWDGATWSAHTAPAAATMAAPTEAAPPGAAIPYSASSWAMPTAGGPVAAKPAWYKRKGVLIPAGIVVVLIVLGAVFGSSSSDASNAMEKAIKDKGEQQLQANLAQLAPGATAKINDVKCVETGNTQQYTCLVHYTVSDTASGQSQKFLLNVAGTCDSKGSCLWHATGQGEPVAG